MQITIGKKIKDLRKRDNRTQEDLATALGVTCQAISRWEANGGYPDMELVPAIANYFHVTIDELFGYHGDREAQIQSIADKAGTALRSLGGFLGKGNGDLTDTVEMLRDALEEFPNEPELMIRLADCLYFLGWQKNGVTPKKKEDDPYQYDDTERNSNNIYWQESLQVYKKLLSLDVPAKYRDASRLYMIHMYKYMGEYEGELLLLLLPELSGTISRSVLTNSDLISSEYGRNILHSLVTLFESVFTDGRCGKLHTNLRYLYETLAILESRHGDHSKALTYFEKSFDHHKEYCRISTETYRYSAPLVAKVSLEKDLRSKTLKVFLFAFPHT